MAKGGLGTGLDSLFDDNSNEVQVKKTLRISEIEPNRDQPRKAFSDEAITALADSIREHGMLQPILVRPISTGGYQIVAGERRWRAAKLAELNEVPIIIKDFSDKELREASLVENILREDLNVVEKALAYNDLMKEYNFTQDDVAKRVGISRAAVANTLRILTLDDELIQMLN